MKKEKDIYRPYKRTGRFLKVIRMRHTLSQKELSDFLGVSYSYYCEIEKGLKFPIDKDFVFKLENHLDFDKKSLIDVFIKEYLKHKEFLVRRRIT